MACSDLFGGWSSAWIDELALPRPHAGKVTSLRQPGPPVVVCPCHEVFGFTGCLAACNSTSCPGW